MTYWTGSVIIGYHMDVNWFTGLTVGYAALEV